MFQLLCLCIHTDNILTSGSGGWCVKHWHGAAPEMAMSHIAFAGAQEGKGVDWMEHGASEMDIHVKNEAKRQHEV